MTSRHPQPEPILRAGASSSQVALIRGIFLLTMDGIIGFALYIGILAVVLAVWSVAIGAAAFSARRTHYVLERVHSPELVSRSVAGAVAVVVGFVLITSITALLLILVPPIGS